MRNLVNRLATAQSESSSLSSPDIPIAIDISEIFFRQIHLQAMMPHLRAEHHSPQHLASAYHVPKMAHARRR
jgi:hypothetical protein